MKKYTVTFQINADETEALNLEYFMKDLLESSVLPALSAELVPLTMTVKKARG